MRPKRLPALAIEYCGIGGGSSGDGSGGQRHAAGIFDEWAAIIEYELSCS